MNTNDTVVFKKKKEEICPRINPNDTTDRECAIGSGASDLTTKLRETTKYTKSGIETIGDLPGRVSIRCRFAHSTQRETPPPAIQFASMCCRGYAANPSTPKISRIRTSNPLTAACAMMPGMVLFVRCAT